MPLVKIEIRQGKSKEYKKALLDGVHQALVHSIKIPDYDRKQSFMSLMLIISKLYQTKQVTLR